MIGGWQHGLILHDLKLWPPIWWLVELQWSGNTHPLDFFERTRQTVNRILETHRFIITSVLLISRWVNKISPEASCRFFAFITVLHLYVPGTILFKQPYTCTVRIGMFHQNLICPVQNAHKSFSLMDTQQNHKCDQLMIFYLLDWARMPEFGWNRHNLLYMYRILYIYKRHTCL